MTAPAHTAAVKALWPLLLVRDMARSLPFYRDTLGFDLVQKAEDGNRIFWCRLSRGNASLMLQQAEPHETPAASQAISLYFLCDDVDPLYDELTARGLRLDKPSVAYYGMKQLHIPEPDGHALCFESEIQGNGQGTLDGGESE